MAVNKELLDTLVFPNCRGDLEFSAPGGGPVIKACAVVHPIRDDIPRMARGGGRCPEGPGPEAG